MGSAADGKLSGFNIGIASDPSSTLGAGPANSPLQAAEQPDTSKIGVASPSDELNAFQISLKNRLTADMQDGNFKDLAFALSRTPSNVLNTLAAAGLSFANINMELKDLSAEEASHKGFRARHIEGVANNDVTKISDLSAGMAV